MPFVVNEKNLKKVFSEHLFPGEQALVVTMAGARGVLGITDQDRILHCNFPFFGKSKIKDKFYIADISSCECTQKNQHTMLLTFVVKGETKSYSSTISPFVDSKTLANSFASIILERNQNARAEYLDEDEDIIEHISTRENNFKITNKNIIQFSKDNELQEKTALSHYTVFDFYPGKMSSQYLYFESESGNKLLLNIGTSGELLSNESESSTHSLINKLYTLFGNGVYPGYLNNEKLLATMRAGKSLMGAVNPSHILKLTSNRLIDLKISDVGSLEVTSTIILSEIEKLNVIRNRGQQSLSDIYELKIKLNDGTKIKYAMSAEYVDEIKVLQNNI